MPLPFVARVPKEEMIKRELPYAMRTLLYIFDLDLSLIEKVKLRNYVVESVDDLYRVESYPNKFRGGEEAVARFLNREYGIPPGSRPMISGILGGRKNTAFNEYLKRQQERLHFP